MFDFCQGGGEEAIKTLQRRQMILQGDRKLEELLWDKGGVIVSLRGSR